MEISLYFHQMKKTITSANFQTINYLDTPVNQGKITFFRNPTDR